MPAGKLRNSARLACACLALLLAWVAAAHGFSAPLLEALAYLLPALGLLVVLHARRYPGERALLAAIAPSPRRSAPGQPRRRWKAPLRVMFPRGGRLIACSLAVRPPPRRFATPF
jgi:hypothetical protein